MEAGRSLVSSPLQFSLGTHLRNRSSSSSSSGDCFSAQVCFNVLSNIEFSMLE